MRVIIAGSRHVKEVAAEALVKKAVADSQFPITKVLCGMAPGIDMAGYRWAIRYIGPGCVEEFPADWKRYHNGAGRRRNREMAAAADALIAVSDGTSPGTAHMIGEMNKRGLPVYILRIILDTKQSVIS